MEFWKPRALKKGDTVGIISPSDWITKGKFHKGLEIIDGWGLNVKLGEHVFERKYDFMAGSAVHRISDFRSMIFDDEVDAIWASEGGYAAAEVRLALGEAEFKRLSEKPMWFIGYSDVTILTNALFSRGMMSLMGANIWGLSYWNEESREWIRKVLFGEEVVFPETGKVIIPGSGKGRLLASNLDTLAFSLGTKYDPILHGDDDIILLVEEWKQEQCIVARQFDAIMDHEKFGRIKGIILGRFSLMRELSYPKWAEEVSLDGLIKKKLLQRKSIPLVRVDYVGHPETDYLSKAEGEETSLAMPNGVKIELSATDKVRISCLERVISQG